MAEKNDSSERQSVVQLYNAAGKKDLLLFDPDVVILITDPAHALFDERALLAPDEKLVRNMMHFGVLEPIIVVRDKESGDVSVVDGRRRVRAAREANRRLSEQGLEALRVPAVVQRGDDGKLAGIMVSTNEQRRADSPIARARKMQTLLDMGKTEDEIAVIFGCSVQTIRDGAILLDATDAVQTAVETGEIGIGQGVLLATQAPEVQRAKVEEIKEIKATKKGAERTRAIREVAEHPYIKLRGLKEIRKAHARVQQAVKDDALLAIVNGLFAWMMGDSDTLDAICEPGEMADSDRIAAEYEQELRSKQQQASVA